MHCISDSNTAAAIEKQHNMSYVAQMLQDEHKDAVNQLVPFTYNNIIPQLS